jgi:hypothetical protein
VIRDLTVTAEMEPIRDEPPADRPRRARLARPLLAAASVVMLAFAVLAVVRALVPGNPAPGAPVQLAASPPGVPATTSSVDSADPQAPGAPATPSRSRGPDATQTTATAGATPEPTPTKTTDEPLALGVDGFTAAYSLEQRWPGGFIARVSITNSGATTQSWQVTVAYPPTVAGFVTDWSNASAQPHTDATPRSATIAGAAPLGARQSVDVFVQFIAMGGSVTPTECSVNATPCT